jgi:hypothetical protein
MFNKANVKIFEEKGCVIVKNAVSKEIVDLLTQYTLFDEKVNFNPDKQVPGAHVKYSDLIMESLLLKLQPVIEENTGKKVYPTYSFYRIYRPGDSLHPHKDRPSCELSITISLGYDYKNSEKKWPIYVEGNAYILEPGDLVCYRGVDLEHWRDTLEVPEGSWHSQAFLHYVDSEGPYAEWKYDKRESLGLPTKIEKLPSIYEPDKMIKNNKNTKSYITYTN